MLASNVTLLVNAIVPSFKAKSGRRLFQVDTAWIPLSSKTTAANTTVPTSALGLAAVARGAGKTVPTSPPVKTATAPGSSSGAADSARGSGGSTEVVAPKGSTTTGSGSTTVPATASGSALSSRGPYATSGRRLHKNDEEDDQESDDTDEIEKITVLPPIYLLAANSSSTSSNVTTAEGDILILSLDPFGTNITITLDGKMTLIVDGASMGFSESTTGIAIGWQDPALSVTDGEKIFWA